MLKEFGKKSDNLINGGKLEGGITIISFSYLVLVLGIATEGAMPSLDDPISFDKIKEDTHVLIIVLGTILIITTLFIASLIKCFKLLKYLNKLLKEIKEEESKSVLKRAKLLLNCIICLTLFPLIILIPQVTSILFFGVTICKFLFYKNNKQINELINNKI